MIDNEHHVDVADGVTYYMIERYKDKREGKKPVLLLHGATDGHITWDVRIKDYSVMDYLASKNFVVYAPDFRNYGKSTKTGGLDARHNVIVEDLVNIVAFIKKRAGVDSIPLAGHMFGAMLAAMYSVHHPEDVSKIALRSPCYLYAGEHAKNVLQPEMMALIDDGVGFIPNRANPKSQAERLVTYDMEVLEWYARKKVEYTPENPTGIAIDMEPTEDGGLPYDHYIPKVMVPTAVIQPDQDDITPMAPAKKLYDDLGTNEKKWVVIKNATHGVIYERDTHLPAMEAIYDWLKD